MTMEPLEPSVKVAELKANLPTYLKVSLLVVVASFFAFSIYWGIEDIKWIFTITPAFSYYFSISNSLPSSTNLLITLGAFQEYGSAVSGILGAIGGTFSLCGIILYLKNNAKHLKVFSTGLLFVALSVLLLLPSSIHHLTEAALFGRSINVYVGTSYLLQVLLIVPSLLLLSYKLKKPQSRGTIIKWASIAASLIIFGLWSKYLLLWVYALSPLGPQQVSLASTIGAANSMLTLLVAGLVTMAVCITFNQKKQLNKALVGISLILFGSFFIVYDVVSVWVHIYSSFLYLTDFWMIVMPILGIVVLKMKSFENYQSANP